MHTDDVSNPLGDRQILKTSGEEDKCAEFYDAIFIHGLLTINNSHGTYKAICLVRFMRELSIYYSSVKVI